MTKQEQEIFRRLKNDFPHYASKCLKIRSFSGEIQPFVFNKSQLYVHDLLEKQKGKLGYVRALVLKGRQMGMSTYIGGRFYHLTTHNFGIQTFILTHKSDATDNLYIMAKRFYENTPKLIKVSVSTNNSKVLKFDQLDSGYKVGTAASKGVGRSSTIQLFHGSEVAFWDNASDHATGIMQAIPNIAGTESILESTANGVGNYFHQEWQKAEAGLSDYLPIFIPWFWEPTYSKEISEPLSLNHTEMQLKDNFGLSDQQLAWRRGKIIQLSVNGHDGEKRFMQEFPSTPIEAFQMTGENTFIDSPTVMKCRKQTTDKYGPIILGVDPARFGDDRTSFIFRQGRVAFDLKSYTKIDLMEVVGLTHLLIEKYRPHRVFIDICGLGAGVVDRLFEIGHKGLVVGVNGGSSPMDKDRYINLRCEMWGKMRDWMNDFPCQIPDSDTLHADLCGLRFKYDSLSRPVLQTKADMKSAGIRSPDEADCLALTFAYPVDTHIMKDRTSYAVQVLREDNRLKMNAIKRARNTQWK
jgi:hypothetical protein